jgi:hypothetical protein
MNRRFPTVLLALFAVLFPLGADALSVDEQVTPANKQDFHIKSEKTGKGIHFSITIDHFAPASVDNELNGWLDVLDGDGNQIVLCSIKNTMNGKSICYEFDVAAKCLDKSEFSFVSHPKGFPAFARYWFYLKDFADGK